MSFMLSKRQIWGRVVVRTIVFTSVPAVIAPTADTERGAVRIGADPGLLAVSGIAAVVVQEEVAWNAFPVSLYL